MNVLIACEFSGIVRDAFIAKGHEAISCDFLPTERPGPHYIGDVLKLIEADPDWDLMIAFPPCTYLCSSGLFWNKRRPERAQMTEEALLFVKRLLDCPIPRIALENPIGCISTRIKKPDQIVEPYMFGDPYKKATCLWLKNLPKLVPTNMVSGREQKCWGTSPQAQTGGKKDRAHIRELQMLLQNSGVIYEFYKKIFL